MLSQAAAVVRPGGHLVYATCSSEPEENDEVAAWFLQTHRGFVQEHAARPNAPASLAGLVGADGAFRTWPFEHDLEAFFAVVLTKR
jgi:16S rRNA (cytosine967-C5)-methyltransferase